MTEPVIRIMERVSALHPFLLATLDKQLDAIEAFESGGS